MADWADEIAPKLVFQIDASNGGTVMIATALRKAKADGKAEGMREAAVFVRKYYHRDDISNAINATADKGAIMAHYIATFSDDHTVELDAPWGLTHAWQIKGTELGGLAFRDTGFAASLELAREATDQAGAGKHVEAVEWIPTVATSDVGYGKAADEAPPPRKDKWEFE